jgi:hypothetical protein
MTSPKCNSFSHLSSHNALALHCKAIFQNSNGSLLHREHWDKFLFKCIRHLIFMNTSVPFCLWPEYVKGDNAKGWLKSHTIASYNFMSRFDHSCGLPLFIKMSKSQIPCFCILIIVSLGFFHFIFSNILDINFDFCHTLHSFFFLNFIFHNWFLFFHLNGFIFRKLFDNLKCCGFFLINYFIKFEIFECPKQE